MFNSKFLLATDINLIQIKRTLRFLFALLYVSLFQHLELLASFRFPLTKLVLYFNTLVFSFLEPACD